MPWKPPVSRTTAAAVAGLLTIGTIAVSATAATSADLASIVGVVELPAGTDALAMNGVTARVRPQGATTWTTVNVDDNTGAFEVTGLTPGEYQACALLKTYRDANGALQKSPNVLNTCANTVDFYGAIGAVSVPGANTSMTLKMDRGGIIAGTLHLPDGAHDGWLKGAKAAASRSVTGGTIGNSAVVDWITGKYTIDTLYPGSYTVRFYSGRYDDAILNASVVPELVQQYWDRASASGAATPVTVDGGTVNGIDAFFERLSSPASFTAAGNPQLTGGSGRGTALTVDAGTWIPEPTTLSYEWFRDSDPIAGATGTTYVTTSDDVGHVVWVQVLAETADFSVATASNKIAVQDTYFTSGSPRVKGDPVVGSSVTCDPGFWSPAPESFTFAWFRDFKALANTGSEYVIPYADAGSGLYCVATAHTAGKPDVSQSSKQVTALRGFDSVGVAEVWGATFQGGIMRVRIDGAFSPSASTLTYQWLRNGQPIEGATHDTYEPGQDDAAQDISVVARASHSGVVTFSSYSSAVRVTGRFASFPTAGIGGNPVVGETVTASVTGGVPASTVENYQWMRNGKAIVGATHESYLLTSEDLDASISVLVGVSAEGYFSPTVLSPGVTVRAPFSPVTVPTIAGKLAPGSTLTAVPGTWTLPPDTVSVQWLRNGTPIPGAQSLTYVLTAADRGASITVRTTASRSGYASVTTVSASTTIPKIFATAPKPTITGTAKAGSTLTAHVGTWSPKPTTISYQWYRDGVAITGATTSTFKVTRADYGRSIRVRVTALKSGYTTLATTSDATVIARGTFTKKPKPTITGTPRVGATLTAKPGTWSPKPSTTSFQWYRNGVAIHGATKSTYTVVAADRDRSLRVRVTVSKPGYVTAHTTSTATMPH